MQLRPLFLETYGARNPGEAEASASLEDWGSATLVFPLTTPYLPLSDPFNGALKRPTSKANS